MEYKITDKHFKIFKAEVLNWIKLFGMFEWEIDIRIAKLTDALAQCSYDVEGRSAVISIDKYWNIQPTVEELKDSARHEVLELMLGELLPFTNTAVPDWLVNTAKHTIIQKLLNAVRSGRLKVT